MSPSSLALVALVLAGCLTGPVLPRHPRPVVATARIAHPAATGVVEEHHLRPPGADDRWYSLTELTDQQICVDFGIRETGAQASRIGRAYLAARAGAERGPYPMTVRGPAGERVATLRDHDGPRLVGTEAGTVAVRRTVDTGRTAQVCVEELRDDYQRVVGCRRYEQQAQTATVTDHVAATLHVAVGGLRWCTRNDGLVPAEADHLELTIDNLRYRIDLTPGRAGPGPWGGRGGSPALPLPGARAPTTSPPAPAGRADDDLDRRATGRVVSRPFRLVDGGQTVASLDRDGWLWRGRTRVARLEPGGRIRDAADRTVLALDRAGVLWRAQGGRVVEVGRIQRELLYLASGTVFALEAGRIRVLDVHARPPRARTSRERLTPASVEVTSALLIAYLLHPHLQLR